MLKLKSQQQNQHQQHSPSGNHLVSESDESKIARQKQMQQKQTEIQSSSHEINNNNNNNHHHSNTNANNNNQMSNNKTNSHPVSSSLLTISSNNVPNSMNDGRSMTESQSTNNQTMPFKITSSSGLNVGSTSLLSHKIISSVLANQQQSNSTGHSKANECDGDENNEKDMPMQNNNNNKSIAETNADERPAIKPKAHHQIPSGNLVVPPRKPISSVAPTSITIAPKSISQPPKIHAVPPNNNIQAPISSVNEQEQLRPALPPKPSKSNQNQGTTINENENDNNNLPIKAKPLTIKKQPLSEQPPKLRSLTSNHKTIQYNTSRRIEMPPSFLFPEIATTELKDNSNDINGNNVNSSSIISKLVNGNVCLTTNNSMIGNQDNGSITSTDETDKSTTPIQDEKPHAITDSVIRRKRNLIGENVKAKLARRVSFDPLALLLDASLEGELELVRKTCCQVPNPSAANDEGITALHNAICAGHFEIVK